MDVLLVVLRLLHIIAAVVWLGLGLATTFYLAPTAIKAGASGMRYLKALFANTNYGSIFAAAAGTTVLMGILMYLFGNSMSHFTTTGNIVLGIGALSGLAAMIHGGAVTGRSTTALSNSLKEIPDGDAPISADSLQVLQANATNLLSHSRVSLILMVVALIGMGSARYL